MAPDAAEIQLKSPNWLFGQRKVEGKGQLCKIATRGSVQYRKRDEEVNDDCDELKCLFSGDSYQEAIFESYLAIASTTEVDNWYGKGLLFDTVEDSEAYKHYAECCQGPALDPFGHDAEKEQYYSDALCQVLKGRKDESVESEMEDALNEYEKIGSDLGINNPSLSSILVEQKTCKVKG